MHNKHELGSADVSSCYCTGWRQLMQPPSHNSNTNTGLPKPSPKLARQHATTKMPSSEYLPPLLGGHEPHQYHRQNGPRTILHFNGRAQHL
eukprot:318608-Pelagomonas_calceolata.AAC.1